MNKMFLLLCIFLPLGVNAQKYMMSGFIYDSFTHERYVMDVQLKDEFSRGYIGNVEAAGGTKERWLGRGFLLGFADKYRLSLTDAEFDLPTEQRTQTKISYEKV